jgi:hypothetical protein
MSPFLYGREPSEKKWVPSSAVVQIRSRFAIGSLRFFSTSVRRNDNRPQDGYRRLAALRAHMLLLALGPLHGHPLFRTYSKLNLLIKYCYPQKVFYSDQTLIQNGMS